MNPKLQQKIDELKNIINSYQVSTDVNYLNRFLAQIEEKQKEIREIERLE